MSTKSVEEVIAELTEITEGVSEDRNLLKAVQTHLTNIETVIQHDPENNQIPPDLIEDTLEELTEMLQALREAELTLFQSLSEVQSTISIVNHLIPTIEAYKNGIQRNHPQEGSNPISPPQS